MTPFIHILFALSYLVAASAVGFTLPAMWPGTDAATAMFAGMAVALAGGLGHEVVSRVVRDRRLEDRLDRLIRSNEELSANLVQAREAIGSMKAAADRGGGNDALLTELRLLRQQVASGSGGLVRGEPQATAKLADGAVGPSPAARPQPGPLMVPVTSGGPVFPVARSKPSAPKAAPAPDGPPDSTVVESVREALKHDRVDIYLQPIVSLPARKHRFYEVFSRIRTGDGESWLPSVYLDHSRKAGLIGAVDNQLLMRSVQLIRETERRHHQIGFFVNVSSATIADPGFMRPFLEFAANNQTLCNKLVFELSQADIRSGGTATMMVLGQIGRLGIRFSMDRLEDLEIEVDLLAAHHFGFIKVEAARFADPGQRLLLGDLGDQLRSQSIDIVAEKIETDNQLAEIADSRIDYGQGFLFGEPRLSRKI